MLRAPRTHARMSVAAGACAPKSGEGLEAGGWQTMELPLTPSISRRFFGFTIPSDDMVEGRYFFLRFFHRRGCVTSD
jgi:hypothetical protein